MIFKMSSSLLFICNNCTFAVTLYAVCFLALAFHASSVRTASHYNDLHQCSEQRTCADASDGVLFVERLRFADH